MSQTPFLHRFADSLWYRRKTASPLLRPLARAFEQGMSLHREAYARGHIKTHALPVPVIVVGNITVGGTGKTPLVIALANALKARGLRVGIVSRGYGGLTPRVPLAVTAKTSPRLAGDEPVLLARRTGCPVYVYPKRVDAGYALLKAHPVDLILSDDGLQHHALARDLELVVVDGERGFGNGELMPAGPLREPLERLETVDFVIYNGPCPKGGLAMELQGETLVGLGNACRRLKLKDLKGERVDAVAAIGHPERFFRHLERQGLLVEGHAFPDHHRFEPRDLAFCGERPLIMTEKDAVKCLSFARPNDWFLPVEAKLPDGFIKTLLARLERNLTEERVKRLPPPPAL